MLERNCRRANQETVEAAVFQSHENGAGERRDAGIFTLSDAVQFECEDRSGADKEAGAR